MHSRLLINQTAHTTEAGVIYVELNLVQVCVFPLLPGACDVKEVKSGQHLGTHILRQRMAYQWITAVYVGRKTCRTKTDI